MNAINRITLSAMFVASLGSTFCGCATTRSDLSGNWNPLAPLVAKERSADSDAAEKDNPVSMAVMWKSSVYEKPGTPSVRGFGGRLFFYDANSQPVKAQGELIVYGYDESQPGPVTDEDQDSADKKFVFPAERFQTHYSESDLGPSYSVWIPWEQVGGFRKSITLIPVFKTTGGQLLRCGHSVDVLPGKKPKSTGSISEISNGKPKTSKNVIAQASFQTSDTTSNQNLRQSPANISSDSSSSPGNGSAHAPRVRTTTFDVPPALAKRMALLPRGLPSSVKGEMKSKTAKPAELSAGTDRSFNSANDTADHKKEDKQTDESGQGTGRVFGVPGTR